MMMGTSGLPTGPGSAQSPPANHARHRDSISTMSGDSRRNISCSIHAVRGIRGVQLRCKEGRHDRPVRGDIVGSRDSQCIFRHPLLSASQQDGSQFRPQAVVTGMARGPSRAGSNRRLCSGHGHNDLITGWQVGPGWGEGITARTDHYPPLGAKGPTRGRSQEAPPVETGPSSRISRPSGNHPQTLKPGPICSGFSARAGDAPLHPPSGLLAQTALLGKIDPQFAMFDAIHQQLAQAHRQRFSCGPSQVQRGRQIARLLQRYG